MREVGAHGPPSERSSERSKLHDKCGGVAKTQTVGRPLRQGPTYCQPVDTNSRPGPLAGVNPPTGLVVGPLSPIPGRAFRGSRGHLGRTGHFEIDDKEAADVQFLKCDGPRSVMKRLSWPGPSGKGGSTSRFSAGDSSECDAAKTANRTPKRHPTLHINKAQDYGLQISCSGTSANHGRSSNDSRPV